jgi:hypothetical protein
MSLQFKAGLADSIAEESGGLGIFGNKGGGLEGVAEVRKPATSSHVEIVEGTVNRTEQLNPPMTLSWRPTGLIGSHGIEQSSPGFCD